ncbi:MAG: hypothetical protein PHQ60_00810 [Sideroxydans sp.]|nr:hypothetical protein [Sideroxydans sp.]
MKAIFKTVLLGLLLLNFSAGHAEELAAIKQEQANSAPHSFNLWINPGLLSYHFDRDAGFRDLNSGFGVQSDVSDRLTLMAGNFINSDHGRSNYAGLAWQPLTWHALKIGLSAGILDGYQTTNNGGKFLAVLPWVTLRNERIGINFTLIPYPHDPHHLGAISGQVILRVW